MEQAQAVVKERSKSLSGADSTVQVIDDRRILVTMLDVVDSDVLSSTLQAGGMVEIVNVGQEDVYTLIGKTVFTSLNPPPIPEPTAPIMPTAIATATTPLTPTTSVSPTDTMTPTEMPSPTETPSAIETEPPVDSPQVYQTIVTSYELDAVRLRDGAVNAQTNVPYHVAIWPTEEGAQALDAHAMGALGQNLGIALDGKIIAHSGRLPEIFQPLFTARSGAFPFYPLVIGPEVETVRAILGSGPLPVPLKVESIESVEPVLGKETIHRAGVAGIIGLAAALVLLPAHYRFPGLLAALSLVVFGFTCFALCKVIPLPISLPSLAGFGVAMLLALRTHLSILEGLREEMRMGRPLKRANRNGLEQTRPSTWHAHLGLLLVAVALCIVGLASTALAILWLGMALLAGTGASGFATMVLIPLLLDLASNVPQEWLQERGWLLGI
jgi:protein-export membrane protein SecD